MGKGKVGERRVTLCYFSAEAPMCLRGAVALLTESSSVFFTLFFHYPLCL